MFGYLERQMFKPTAGGYVFQPPPPTRFHRTQSYVVNEAQKEEILVIARRGRTYWLRAATLAAMGLALATGMLVDTLGGALWLAIFIGVCLWVVAQILGIALTLHLKLRQLKPFLAELPRSKERLFAEFDRNQILFGPPSSRYIAIWCALFAFLLGERFEHHPPFADVLSTLWLIALALCLISAIRTSK